MRLRLGVRFFLIIRPFAIWNLRMKSYSSSSSKIFSLLVLSALSMNAVACSDPAPGPGNHAPVASVASASGTVGKPVSLDGSGSKDADGDKLSFKWSIKSAPKDSKAALDKTDSDKPS